MPERVGGEEIFGKICTRTVFFWQNFLDLESTGRKESNQIIPKWSKGGKFFENFDYKYSFFLWENFEN